MKFDGYHRLNRTGPIQAILKANAMSLRREAFRYTPYFCEENIWWLARNLVDAGYDEDEIRVLLFSNPWQSVALLKQRASVRGRPVIWDYHVVLMLRTGSVRRILDFDTQLDFDALCSDYLRNTFPVQSGLPKHCRAWVRSIPASGYLKHFYSDRAHMRGHVPESGFPRYPVIRPTVMEDAIRLDDYRDMAAELPDGSRVTTITSLLGN
jgi:hypothetical protein